MDWRAHLCFGIPIHSNLSFSAPLVEIDNLLNKTVWSFGTEFIDFKALSPSSTPAERQEFLDSFLLTTRTLRPRMIRVEIRFDF